MCRKMIEVSLSGVLGKGYNEFHHSKNFYRVVKGGRGSKKSKNTAIDFICKILKHPWANILVVRRFGNTNRQSTYTDFLWAMNRLKVGHLFNTNASYPEITVKDTGQKILFRGLDDPLKITSISVEVGVLCWVWFEELYQIENESDFDTVVESIRGEYKSNDFYKQVTATFNPWHEKHWSNDAFFKRESKSYRDDVFSRTTTFRNNEFLDDHDRKRYLDLYRTNPKRARVVCDGDWGISEGLVFDNITSRPIDFGSEIDVNKFHRLVGLDFGYENDPTALIVSYLDVDNKRLYIIDEYYKAGMSTNDISEMIKDKELNNAVIIADNSEGRLIDELRKEKGIRRIKKSIKGPDSVRYGITKLQELEIICDIRCKNTMDEFYSYSYKKDKLTGKFTNEPIDEDNHLMDALRYSLQCLKKSARVKILEGGL